MTTNLNVPPYFDDHDENKNFSKILFKPGYSIQARELTQLQTILQDQISKFGNHIFQQGSIVIPGNSFLDSKSPYIKVESEFNSVAVNPDDYVGKVLVNNNSGVKAIIRTYTAKTEDDPLTFFINYTGGGGQLGSQNIFSNSDTLSVAGSSSLHLKAVGEYAVGLGTLAFVNKGVYYVNGKFITVHNQSVVVSKYTQNASASVLLKIEENIITSDIDETLLDPAQGSYNYAAPGADRMQINLVLVSLPTTINTSTDYIELIRIENGVIQYHSRFPKYSELEKSLARRTMDESGDYVVSGFDINVREHNKSGRNNGLFVNGDSSKYVYEINPGVAYIGGYEIDSIVPTNIESYKARDTNHSKVNPNVSFRPQYGQYIFVSDVKRLPDFSSHEKIDLYNHYLAGTKIGTARVLGIDYIYEGIYALYIYDLTINPGLSLDSSVGRIVYINGSAIVLKKLIVPGTQSEFIDGEQVGTSSNNQTAVVKSFNRLNSELFVYKNDIGKNLPSFGQQIVGVTSAVTGVISSTESLVTVSKNNSSIFEIPLPNVSTIRTSTGTSDISYTTWKKLIINDIKPDGTGSVPISGGFINNLEQSSFLAADSNGVVEFSKFSIEGQSIEVTGATPHTTIDLFVNIIKNNVIERTKSLTIQNDTGKDPDYSITLSKADVYKLISVTSTVDGDVTDRFTFDSGQTDYYYDYGSIKLVGIMPTGVLNIQYQYFSHSPSGDYFSCDSYKNSGLGLEYLGLIPEYRTVFDSNIINLKNALDFRKIRSDTAELILPASRVSGTIQYFMPRIDSIILSKTGNIKLLTGTPSDTPIAKKPGIGEILLHTISVPAYTESISDIKLKAAKNRRFTMQDINVLNNRVSNLEYYSTLNALENDLISMDVVDPSTGLNRYKTGFLVDNFKNLNIISDINSRQFTTAYSSNTIGPSREQTEVSYSISNGASNYTQTGSLITLPYEHEKFVVQPTSTRILNINPYLVFSWKGVMTINPSIDSWIEREDLPTVFNQFTETIVVTREEIVETTQIVPFGTITVQNNMIVPTPITVPSLAAAPSASELSLSNLLEPAPIAPRFDIFGGIFSEQISSLLGLAGTSWWNTSIPSPIVTPVPVSIPVVVQSPVPIIELRNRNATRFMSVFRDERDL